MRERFWELPIGKLNRQEWEALCDGCGKCCLHKLEDADTGDFYLTNVACKLLDIGTARCSDYRNRRTYVPDCVKLTPESAGRLPWLPDTCAYRLRTEGEPLPAWHYLICGDRQEVHRAGVSVAGKAVSEVMAGPIEQHIVWPEGMDPLQVEVRPDDDGADGDVPGDDDA